MNEQAVTTNTWPVFATLHDCLWGLEFGLERMIATCDLIRGHLQEGNELDYFSGNPPETVIHIRFVSPPPECDRAEHELRTAVGLLRDQDIPRHWEALATAKEALHGLPADLRGQLDEISNRNWVNHTRRILNDLSVRYLHPSFLESPQESPGFPNTVADLVDLCRRRSSIDGWRKNLTELRERIKQLKACEPKVGDDTTVPAHSTDFRSVNWFGAEYSFTVSQAKVVALLWDAWTNNTPDIGDETLLQAIDHEYPPASLRNLFRAHSAWGTMIVSGGSKGSHRLAEARKS